VVQRLPALRWQCEAWHEEALRTSVMGYKVEVGDSRRAMLERWSKAVLWLYQKKRLRNAICTLGRWQARRWQGCNTQDHKSASVIAFCLLLSATRSIHASRQTSLVEMNHKLLIQIAFACPVFGAQPSAPDPKAAPLRELPWAQLNFLHTTDIHGWWGGHLQE